MKPDNQSSAPYRRDEHDEEGRVEVGYADVWFCYRFDVDPKLLGDFTPGRRFIRFVRFDFAAGEFPDGAVPGGST
jgi:hypothetical protein